MKKCYICNEPGTTREHVPPDAFFPEGYRTNLWTVRSCPQHNLGNSKDVEYVFGLIVNELNVTGSAHELSQSKVFRAFDKSSGLLHAVFRDAQLALVNGETRPVFRFDLPRFKVVMSAIAYAVYNKTSGKSFTGNWRVICPNLSTSRKLYRGLPDKWGRLNAMLRSLHFTEVRTPEPEVFKCAVNKQDEENFIYQFIFYNGFTVYAWAVPAQAAAAA